MKTLLAISCAFFFLASTLGPNQKLEQQVEPGQVHTIDIPLRAGDYARIAVTEKREGVDVTLVDPQGQRLSGPVNPVSAEKEIRVSLIAGQSGLYGLQVRALERSTAPVAFVAEIEEVRAAVETDRPRVAAERLLTEGEKVRAEGGMENLRAAFVKYNAAIPLYQSAGDMKMVGITYHLCGLVHDYLADFRASADCYERGIAVRQQMGDARAEGETLANLGPVYRQMGELDKARVVLERAVNLLRGTGDALSEGTAFHNLGTLHWNLGDYPKAMESYREAARIRRANGFRAGEAESLSGVAIALRNMGQTQQALDLYTQALVVKRELKDARGEMTVLNNLAVAYSLVGEFERTLEHLEPALVIARRLGDRQWEATAHLNRGIAYRNLGEYEKALDAFRASLELRTAIGNKRGQAEVLSNMGLLQEILGNTKGALELYERALPLNRENRDQRGEGFTLGNLGAAHTKLGDGAKAAQLLSDALKVQRAIGDEQGAAQTLTAKARMSRKAGDLAEARAAAEEAIASVESLRGRIGLPSLRSSYRALNEDHYALYVDILMDLHRRDPAGGYDGQALLASERARARTMRETLALGNLTRLPGVDAGLVVRLRTVQNQLGSKERTRVTLPNDKQEQQATLDREIRALLDEHETLETKIRASSPQYASLTQSPAITLEGIRSLLDSDTSLLVYSLGQERSYTWVLTSSSLHVAELPPRAQVEELARTMYGLVSAGRKRELEKALRDTIERLSAAVIRPVSKHLTTRRVAVVADGALQYVPFAALTDGDAAAPLVARHELIHLPSVSVLELLRGRANGAAPSRAIAVFADPVLEPTDPRVRTATRLADAKLVAQADLLRSAAQSGVGSFQRLPYTNQEAEGILSLAARGDSLKATGFRASRAAVLQTDLRRFGTLHFATHGLLNNENPQLSGIVLSLVDEQGDPQDGFLRVHEICGLDLDAELVVVSACRTALGKEIRGEGLVGITRGFMFAGARRVMATLWDVRDQASAELMTRFYRGMFQKSLEPAAALRAAQLSMQKDPRWQSPFYWAPFQVQGDWK